MSLDVAIQSVLFYVLSCSTCAKISHRRKAKAQAKRDRAEKHLIVARWLEGLSADRVEDRVPGDAEVAGELAAGGQARPGGQAAAQHRFAELAAEPAVQRRARVAVEGHGGEDGGR